jgi:hypothetical protein
MTEKITPILPVETIEACPCGGKTFYLLNDGRVECRSCGFIKLLIRWSLQNTENNPK